MARPRKSEPKEEDDLKADWYREDIRDDAEPEPAAEPEPEVEDDDDEKKGRGKAKAKGQNKPVILRCHSSEGGGQVRDVETTAAELTEGVDLPLYTIRVQVLPS